VPTDRDREKAREWLQRLEEVLSSDDSVVPALTLLLVSAAAEHMERVAGVRPESRWRERLRRLAVERRAGGTNAR